jgi:hypothetical protein
MPLGTALIVAVLTGCGGPQGQGGQGATCFRDDECAYGLVCAAIPGGERTCTSDVSALVGEYAPALPPAGGRPGAASGGTGGTAGDRAMAGAGSGGQPSAAGAPGSAGAGAASMGGNGGAGGEATGGTGGAPSQPGAGTGG